MPPKIDNVATGRQIKKWMEKRGLTVEDVRKYLSLGCVQSIYHWLNGQCLPSMDNIYALSELLQVSVDELIVGDRKYFPMMYMEYEYENFQQLKRLARYQGSLPDYIISTVSPSGASEMIVVEVKCFHMLATQSKSNHGWSR
ncbi:MAG: helix-turn-helix transcriptional regulator [Lachnospiraceae bacterium]|nr:helix-turn-helix transcriptional regulator [Lachnospiraceae bacterium]